MNKFSNYVASVGLAAMIGCNSGTNNETPVIPADQGTNHMTTCKTELAGYTTGYSSDFNADFDANIMRPYGANLTAVSPLEQCLSYVAGFDQLPNPENKTVTVGEGPSVMVGEDNLTVAYRDLVIAEANLGGAVTSYLGGVDSQNNAYAGDATWAKEFIEGPIDARVCEVGKEYWRADSVDEVNLKVRTFYVPMKKFTSMLSAKLHGKYGVQDATDKQTVEDIAKVLGHDLTMKGYVVSGENCPEDSQ